MHHPLTGSFRRPCAIQPFPGLPPVLSQWAINVLTAWSIRDGTCWTTVGEPLPSIEFSSGDPLIDAAALRLESCQQTNVHTGS